MRAGRWLDLWERGMARVDHYEFGRVVVDGRQETSDLIVLPDRVVRHWWRHDGHALVPDDLAEVLDELPSRLVGAPAPTAACGPTPARSGSSRSTA